MKTRKLSCTSFITNSPILLFFLSSSSLSLCLCGMLQEKKKQNKPIFTVQTSLQLVADLV